MPIFLEKKLFSLFEYFVISFLDITFASIKRTSIERKVIPDLFVDVDL